jgi:GTP-binding protein
MIEGYLIRREHLNMVLALVDAEVGPTKLDVQALEWLRGHDLPHAVVATKLDKVKASMRVQRQAELAAGCGVTGPEVVWVSAAKGTGVEQLRGLVRSWLAV